MYLTCKQSKLLGGKLRELLEQVAVVGVLLTLCRDQQE